MDQIVVSDIRVDCVVGVNPEERVKLQPVVVSLTLFTDASECGRSDALADTVNYAAVCKRAARVCRETQAYTLEALAAQLARAAVLSPGCERVQRVRVRLDKPEAMRLGRPSIEIERDRRFFLDEERRFGAFSSSSWNASTSSTPTSSPSASAAEAGVEGVGELVFLALGSNLGRRAANIQRALRLLQGPVLPTQGCAPDGLGAADGGGAVPSSFVRLVASSFLYETPAAYVVDQPAFLNACVSVLTNLPPDALLDHIKDGVETPMGRVLEGSGVGPRFGPRCIDVDILLFGGRTLSIDLNGRRPLVVPHPRLSERDFALGPLCDLAPGLVHPAFGVSVRELFSRLPRVHLVRVTPLVCDEASLAEVTKSFRGGVSGTGSLGAAVTGIECSLPERLLSFGAARRTLVMGVLNITPDSFSDGGECMSETSAVARARALLAAGADIIDVGGQSTRPGAEFVSADEEAARVLPVLRALRRELGPQGVVLSVDTFSAQVATLAVLLPGGGAHIVNDVSAGTMDGAMLATVARLGVPYVAMHMRGTPQTMSGFAVYSPQSAESFNEATERAAVVNAVRLELSQRAHAALAQGVLRWNLLLDPGLGFSKARVHSLALLAPSSRLFPVPGHALEGCIQRGLPSGPNESFPLLYGPSRKGFVGAATGRTVPGERDWGTAAAVAAAVTLGAGIVRVHNVEALVDVVRVADAIAARDQG